MYNSKEKNNIQLEQATATISSCANFIKAHDVTAAVKEYDSLTQLATINTIKQIVIRYQKYNRGWNDNIIKFMDILPTAEERHLGYKLIYQELKRMNNLYSQYTMTLAYRAYFGLKDDKLSAESRNHLSFIWNSLPKIFKEFPWEKPFSLYSLARRQLFVASNIEYDNRRQLPFVWKNDEEKIGNKQEQWIIEGVENGMTFRIKSVRYGYYLYPDSKEFNYDEKQRRVFLWKSNLPVKYAEWIFVPTKLDSFQLLNAQWEEYMCITKSDFDNDHRQVCTWKYGLNSDAGADAFDWKIARVFD